LGRAKVIKTLPLLLLATLIFLGLTVNSLIPVEKEVKYAEKVVILSIDAARADITYELASEGKLPGFKRIMDEGVYAEGMIVSFPSATAVSHAVISTGAPPMITGITGNKIHLLGMPVYKSVAGFDGSYLKAEPLWIAADRQGLKAVVAAFPQSTPTAWKDVINNSVLFNPYDSFIWPISYSTLYTTNASIPAATYIELTQAVNWSNLESLGSVYVAYEASIKLGDDTWWLLVYDSNGDNLVDKVAIVPLEKDASKALAVLSEGQWSPPLNTTITYQNVTYVIAPRFKAIKIDVDDFRLYRSLMRPLNSPKAWYSDEELAREVWNNVVVEVGMITDGDWWALTHGWIDEETYMETVHFTNEFFKKFTEYLLKHTDWDLLMSYTPIIDNVYHQFLGLIDPEMPYTDNETIEKYWTYIEQAHIWADEIVQTILNNVDLDKTVVIVISDHGQWSVKKYVKINSILYIAGLIAIDEEGNVIWNQTKAWYVGYNQIFVNLQGREEGGVVPPEEYWDVVYAIKRALTEVVDPETGEPVFSLVIDREEGYGLGLSGERAGDVIFSLRPGYAASGGAPKIVDGEVVIFEDAIPLKTAIGWHGDLPYYKELHAIFGAVGANIVHGKLGIIRSTDIAPTVATLLGIDPPKDSVGIALPIVKPLVKTTTITKMVTTVLVTTTTATEVKEVTKTETMVKTVTETTTLEKTATETTTATVTETLTKTATVTKTEVSTTTKEVGYADPMYTAIAAILGLIIGAGIVMLIRRK